MTDEPSRPAKPDDAAAETAAKTTPPAAKPDPFAGFSIDFGGRATGSAGEAASNGSDGGPGGLASGHGEQTDQQGWKKSRHRCHHAFSLCEFK